MPLSAPTVPVGMPRHGQREGSGQSKSGAGETLPEGENPELNSAWVQGMAPALCQLLLGPGCSFPVALREARRWHRPQDGCSTRLSGTSWAGMPAALLRLCRALSPACGHDTPISQAERCMNHQLSKWSLQTRVRSHAAQTRGPRGWPAAWRARSRFSGQSSPIPAGLPSRHPRQPEREVVGTRVLCHSPAGPLQSWGSARRPPARVLGAECPGNVQRPAPEMGLFGGAALDPPSMPTAGATVHWCLCVHMAAPCS